MSEMILFLLMICLVRIASSSQGTQIFSAAAIIVVQGTLGHSSSKGHHEAMREYLYKGERGFCEAWGFTGGSWGRRKSKEAEMVQDAEVVLALVELMVHAACT